MCAIFLLTAFGLLLAPSFAAAQEGGGAAPRCTIKGTKKADRLTGTQRRDVICGFGGRDRIVGRGGRDLLLGGPGDDSLVGNKGSDELKGGPANDQMTGGPGPDRLEGLTGNDSLYGNPENDHLLGGAGNDLLDGGLGSDTLSPGAGVNRCLHIEDDLAPPSCDATAPRLISLDVSPAAVNTAAESQWVAVEARVTDDLAGVEGSMLHGVVRGPVGEQQALLFLFRREGNAKDGIYRGGFELPRYAATGKWEISLAAVDRTLNQARWEAVDLQALGFPSGVEQVGPGDAEPPRLVDLSISPTSVNTSGGDAQIFLRMHVTDDYSGIEMNWDGSSSVRGYAFRTLQGGTSQFTTGGDLRRVSGTDNDAIYEGWIRVKRYSATGTWNLSVGATDRAGNVMRYASFELQAAGFPGYFEQTGPGDTTPPQLTALSVTPRRVNTATGDQQITFEARATDGLAGVNFVVAEASFGDTGGAHSVVLQRVSGDEFNGLYRGTLTLPQYSAQGTWNVAVWVMDNADTSNYYWSNELQAKGFPGTFYNGP